MSNLVRSWGLRLLLVALLLFASELLWWNIHLGLPFTVQTSTADSATRTLITLAAYVTIAALLTDFAARFRIRDIFGLLLLGGVYGLSHTLLISPQTGLRDVPLTIATQALGAHTLAGLAAFALIGWLAGRGQAWILPVAAAIIGAAWAVWTRGSAVYRIETSAGGAPGFEQAAVTAALFIGLVLAATLLQTWVIRRRPHNPPADYRLSPLAWILVGIAQVAILVDHWNNAQIDTIGLILCLVLYALCVLMLWYHKRARGDAYLPALVTFVPRWRWLVVSLIVFMLAAALGWQIPGGGGAAEPVQIIAAAFSAFGLVWLPAVALVMGWRALRRETRALRL